MAAALSRVYAGLCRRDRLTSKECPFWFYSLFCARALASLLAGRCQAEAARNGLLWLAICFKIQQKYSFNFNKFIHIQQKYSFNFNKNIHIQQKYSFNFNKNISLFNFNKNIHSRNPVVLFGDSVSLFPLG